MALSADEKSDTLFARPPRRVVSLVPSDTYNLAVMGLGATLVGRTEYCVLPQPLVESVPTVGGTKNVDVEAVRALQPDLIVANREENRRKDIEDLDACGLPVLLCFPKTVQAGLEHVERLARLFAAHPDLDRDAVTRARQVFEQRASLRFDLVPTFVPIWMDPLMTANDDTFIADALALAGATNVFGDRLRRYPRAADLGQREPLPPSRVVGRDTRYPRVRHEEVVQRRPALVLLPDEPHAFCQADAEVFRALDIPARVTDAGDGEDSIRFCDGKDLMWYGFRAIEGAERLASIVSRTRAILGAGS